MPAEAAPLTTAYQVEPGDRVEARVGTVWVVLDVVARRPHHPVWWCVVVKTSADLHSDHGLICAGEAMCLLDEAFRTGTVFLRRRGREGGQREAHRA
jgi:hypothetical protein